MPVVCLVGSSKATLKVRCQSNMVVSQWAQFLCGWYCPPVDVPSKSSTLLGESKMVGSTPTEHKCLPLNKMACESKLAYPL